MVTNVTSLTGNGLRDWLIQRVSAVYLGIYAIFIFMYLLLHPTLQYTDWHQLFEMHWVQAVTAVAFIMFLLHAWIGIWTVTTDYIAAKGVRITVQMLVALFLLGQLVWSLMILWGHY